ncbi:MAG: cyclic nucleotide-binding domain-containing protein [Bryobacterales bacterium]|nr:cyclic nucleotide-binding domain-containing protein [Bryobacterales bacterium]
METQSLERIIAGHPFFADLDDSYINLLVGCASNLRFEAGKHIFREGEEAHQFYLIRQGRVALQIAAPQHKPIVVETLGEGEILGWSWLLPPYIWKFHAYTTEVTRVIALDGVCLRNKCEQNHDVGYELLKRFAQIIERRLEATRLQLLDVYAAR